MEDIDELVAFLSQRKRSTRFNQLRTILLNLGFQTRQRRRGGSHYVFSHPSLDMLVVLVSHGKNDMLPEYQVIKAIRALEQLKALR